MASDHRARAGRGRSRRRARRGDSAPGDHGRGGSQAEHHEVSLGSHHLITIGGAIAFLVFALIYTFAFARWAQDVLERAIGAAYGAIVRYVMILAGISVVIVVALSLLGFRVAQLVVGGAVTGVLITIAAQQSLSNLFAGVMIQFAQPFRVGDQVRIRSGALAGTIEGTVTEFSITYVRLETEDGRILLPNSQVLAAAVSPLRPPRQVPMGDRPACLVRADGMAVAGTQCGGRPPGGLSVILLVLLNDLRRNPATIADFHARTLGPRSDFRAAPAMCRRPPLSPANLRRHLACTFREALHHFVELLAVLLAEVDFIVPAIEAEHSGHLFAARNLFRIVVTGECD
jgi:hypothetical protein